MNAGIGWSLTAVVALVAVEGALTGGLLWGALAVLFVAVAAAPAVVTRDWTTVVPWPLLLVGATAMAVRAVGHFPEAAGYLTITVLALAIALELDVFTRVDMTRRFAVCFAVLTTMAAQGLWTVAEFYSDKWLETNFLGSQTELQWDFVIVTAVAIVVGGLFELFLQRVGYFGVHENRGAEVSST